MSPLPTFLIIGAQKSATRWLRVNLGAVPGVFTASEELMYFNDPERMAEAGTEWYRSQFEGWAGEPIVGEACPSYLAWRFHPDQMAERIRSLVPDVRLVAIVRNPVDRAESALLHHIRRGRFPVGSNVLDVVRSMPPEDDVCGIVSIGWYATNLAPYLETFGDQVLVLVHDDLVVDPSSFFLDAAHHVGVAIDVAPPGTADLVYSNQPRPLRQTWRRFRGKPWVRRLDPDERRELFTYFRDDVARLETVLDRDLSAWDPTAIPRATPRSAP